MSTGHSKNGGHCPFSIPLAWYRDPISRHADDICAALERAPCAQPELSVIADQHRYLADFGIDNGKVVVAGFKIQGFVAPQMSFAIHGEQAIGSINAAELYNAFPAPSFFFFICLLA